MQAAIAVAGNSGTQNLHRSGLCDKGRKQLHPFVLDKVTERVRAHDATETIHGSRKRLTHCIQEGIHHCDAVHYDHGTVPGSLRPKPPLLLFQVHRPWTHPRMLFQVQDLHGATTSSDPQRLVRVAHPDQVICCRHCQVENQWPVLVHDEHARERRGLIGDLRDGDQVGAAHHRRLVEVSGVDAHVKVKRGEQ